MFPRTKMRSNQLPASLSSAHLLFTRPTSLDYTVPHRGRLAVLSSFDESPSQYYDDECRTVVKARGYRRPPRSADDDECGTLVETEGHRRAPWSVDDDECRTVVKAKGHRRTPRSADDDECHTEDQGLDSG